MTPRLPPAGKRHRVWQASARPPTANHLLATVGNDRTSHPAPALVGHTGLFAATDTCSRAWCTATSFLPPPAPRPTLSLPATDLAVWCCADALATVGAWCRGRWLLPTAVAGAPDHTRSRHGHSCWQRVTCVLRLGLLPQCTARLQVRKSLFLADMLPYMPVPRLARPHLNQPCPSHVGCQPASMPTSLARGSTAAECACSMEVGAVANAEDEAAEGVHIYCDAGQALVVRSHWCPQYSHKHPSLAPIKQLSSPFAPVNLISSQLPPANLISSQLVPVNLISSQFAPVWRRCDMC